MILPLEHERTQGDEAVTYWANNKMINKMITKLKSRKVGLTIDGYPGNPTNCLRVAVPPLVSEN